MATKRSHSYERKIGTGGENRGETKQARVITLLGRDSGDGRMVRCFFDLAQDGVLSPDDTGLESESHDAAKMAAVRTLAFSALTVLV